MSSRPPSIEQPQYFQGLISRSIGFPLIQRQPAAFKDQMMFRNSVRSSLALIMLCAPSMVSAMDFLEKRVCVLDFGNNHAPVHTRCVIHGGIQNGTIDVSVRTPDGRTYPLDGPVDGEEGHKYLLQNRPAVHSVDDSAEAGSCYARTDGKLKICLGAINE
jgi:hypothetical protein